jgi:DNA mismatch repair protein MutS
MQEFSTPMMKQYMEIKRKYPDCLLFFRMGDFYELFMEDAHLGSRILNITLTSKSGGKDGKIPMAGVPYHAADTYIAKLVKAGNKVAICEQLSPPNKKGLVKRGVVRIVTPGTLLDEKNLTKKDHNYIVALVATHDSIGLGVADISTGYFAVFETENQVSGILLRNELQRLRPAECIISEELYNDPDFLKQLHQLSDMNIFPYRHFVSASDAEKVLKKHFAVRTLEAFGIAGKPAAQQAGAALLNYLTETQNGKPQHIKKIVTLTESDSLILDRSTMVNLELFSTIRETETRGSLLSIIDFTITAMGGRLLKTWMKNPLSNKEKIEARLESVESFSSHARSRDAIRIQLEHIPDIERLLARLSVNLGNARDIVHLKQAIAATSTVANMLVTHDVNLIRQVRLAMKPELAEVVDRIDRIFVADPPLSVREGHMIREGVDTVLDRLRETTYGSKTWITELERRERAVTKISSLKVRFNKVFGYYIEVSKSNLHLVPAHYERKQTLVNAERFSTKELKQHEEIILTAEEKINDIEYKIYKDTLDTILTYTDMIQKAAESIAIIDCLTNFSHLADRNRYTRPKLLYSGEIRIKEGRHPVVENLLETERFVPNDITLDNVSQSLIIITGPNMAGKSVLIRQIALIVLMAHIGCFVPASSAHLSIVDRIFVRSGASDVITAGLSTFMVEMVETAHILHHATGQSLIIMDEIGRGTSTYDGISIAWAVAEYLATHYDTPPKVLFATHYHELQSLEAEYPKRIKNFHMAVTEQHNEPIFLHSLLPGAASHSFGIAVAKLAGVPGEVINQAKTLLTNLENRHVESADVPLLKNETERLSDKIQQDAAESYAKSNTLFDRLLIKELESLDIATITPLEALNKLAKLKEQLKLLQQEKQQLFNAG